MAYQTLSTVFHACRRLEIPSPVPLPRPRREEGRCLAFVFQFLYFAASVIHKIIPSSFLNFNMMSYIGQRKPIVFLYTPAHNWVSALACCLDVFASSVFCVSAFTVLSLLPARLGCRSLYYGLHGFISQGLPASSVQ